jgi:hypothetical protein
VDKCKGWIEARSLRFVHFRAAFCLLIISPLTRSTIKQSFANVHVCSSVEKQIPFFFLNAKGFRGRIQLKFSIYQVGSSLGQLLRVNLLLKALRQGNHLLEKSQLIWKLQTCENGMKQPRA